MKASPTTLPTAVLVGRANVGKSTLFNRLTETSRAMISDVPGTTRDRKDGLVLWRGQLFRIVDTGGIEYDKTETFDDVVQHQTELAMKEADIILMVLDSKEGLLQQDLKIARSLIGSDKPVIVVGNKADGRTKETVTEPEWYRTGLEIPRPVSAVRGNGLGDLLDTLFEMFQKLGKHVEDYKEEFFPKIAFIGEPNVGKSSIINEILGEERFITSPIAHTTREPNDTLVEFDNKQYIIVDTAGVRRKARVSQGLERAGVKQTLEVLKRVDIVVLVLDATKPIDQQEKKLAGLIRQAGVGCVIAVNKWDLMEGKETQAVANMKRYVYGHLPFIRFAPILTISAKERQRIHKLFPLFDTILKERERTIDDNALDKFLNQTISRHKPARGKGVAHPKIFRLKQVGINPPRFELVIKGMRTDVLHASYSRFLENRLRETFGFTGTPIIFYAIPSKKV
ncbi:ribosome biogenesis GTPase Der [Candidatus Uhrbacteria bacterium CG10_big_fil_rev_8_21_14_0_10_50_16]|uniref:GTPase Der n=1 Tax=Candidatus Uhrbacteria bacterium CG10_big_fil_rev_8_21_14_0_10_50_16 TaxID=1975039 RepID=A0A2H0RM17_9BACT|nr:MAG: ribosome biogenesis GTPase Der [Candidatus Uhrbacteria bacterium CG10_big_fil_rev_8_21_14_0_10_50_16]